MAAKKPVNIQASQKSGQPAPTAATPTRASSRTITETVGAWVWPTPSTRITSQFEEGHHAIDISVPVGQPLYAPTSGRVLSVIPGNTGYGNHIVLETSNGLQIILAHLSGFNVTEGQTVNAGQLIGLTGNTGNSTGPHLHYEIRQGSGRINPFDFYTGAQPTAPQANTPKSDNLPGGYIDKAITGIVQSGVNKLIPGSDKLTIKVNWGNVTAVVIGFILFGLGISGIILQETGKQVFKPLVEPITDALKGNAGQ